MYWPTVCIPGEDVDAIPVVLDSKFTCFNPFVSTPTNASLLSPTTIVLTVQAMPVCALKSRLIFVPEMDGT